MTSLIVLESAGLVFLALNQREARADLHTVSTKLHRFCLAYRDQVESARYDLAHTEPEVIKQRAFYSFRALASEPYYRACDVDPTGLGPELSAASECYLRNDYSCAAAVASKLLQRIPVPDAD